MPPAGRIDFFVHNRPSAGGSATLYIAGNALKAGGGHWVVSSVIRLKREIIPFEEGLYKIDLELQFTIEIFEK